VRRVTRGPCPPSLDGSESIGGKETAAALAYHSQTPPVGGEPKFAAYKEEDVKQALTAMFRSKCAYCEFRYAAGMPVDVDHYRPKGKIELADKSRIEGYFWLVATWSNLLPTCIDCNRKRGQEVDGTTEQVGKGMRFPLVDETKRATGPGMEAGEEPLLLDPTVDDPADHLTFYYGRDVVVAADDGAGPSPRGAATIEVLGLNRHGLVGEREEVRLWLEEAIGRYVEAEEELVLHPESAYALRQREIALKEMGKRARPERPHSAMVRQRLEDFFA
jgi:uncharacterized protein (TIGR02646 family)